MDNRQTSHMQLLSGTAATINRQVPGLVYFGLAFWMAWNTVAFSGTFWFHDTDNIVRADDLTCIHLIFCVIVLCVLGGFTNLTRWLTNRRWFVWLGALVACFGTTLIVVTRADLFPSFPAYVFGGICSGIGTTVLFVTAVPYFGTLPPRRSLLMLSSCSLVSSLIFFVMAGCSDDVASVLFILLPLGSAILLSLRPRPQEFGTVKQSSEGVERRLAPRFFFFLAFVVICSMTIELARGFILVGISPTFSYDSRSIAQFINVFIMIGIVLLTLLIPDQYNCMKLYSISTCALIVLITVMAALALYNLATASIATVVCGCYNLAVWAIFAYIAFQSESNGFRIFLFGNAALAAGTIFGILVTHLYFNANLLDQENLRLVLVIAGGAILIGLLYMLSEQSLAKLLPPIEKLRLEQDVIGSVEKRPKQWVLTCEALARQFGLSEREQEIFVALARGRSPQDIAEKDFISIYTVRAHIRSIYAKLDIHSRKEMLEFIEKHIADR